MAGEAIISVTGNAGSDAEMRKTPSGTLVTSFSLANTPRTLDKTTKEWKDLETVWYRCFVWGKDATGAANEIRKGSRVFINGRFLTETFIDKEGKEKKALIINADSYGLVPRNTLEPVTVQSDKPIEDPIDDPWAV